MSYELAIHPEAEKEWAKLDGAVKKRFKDKLANDRLQQPILLKKHSVDFLTFTVRSVEITAHCDSGERCPVQSGGCQLPAPHGRRRFRRNAAGQIQLPDRYLPRH